MYSTLTLGTGFGCGIVHNRKLLLGDNSNSGEVWITSNRFNPVLNAEEGVSARAIIREYVNETGLKDGKDLMPKDVYNIATGAKEGDSAAAKKAFGKMGHLMGDVIGNLIALIDGIVVIGGGLTGASSLYMPAVMEELNRGFTTPEGISLPRAVQQVYNWNDDAQKAEFLKDHSTKIQVPGTDKKVAYDPSPRLAIATSGIGASKAIAIGAYAFAVNELEG